ncbi:hypothetical protein JB92DRAFT_2257354 [Gautieria morchelliformis]|nr:hypothetical protein JB92DRAFT_2257354 [Gautieria morchelliformis]
MARGNGICAPSKLEYSYSSCVFAVCMETRLSRHVPLLDTGCVYSDVPWLRDLKYQAILSGPVREGILPDSSTVQRAGHGNLMKPVQEIHGEHVPVVGVACSFVVLARGEADVCCCVRIPQGDRDGYVVVIDQNRSACLVMHHHACVHHLLTKLSAGENDFAELQMSRSTIMIYHDVFLMIFQRSNSPYCSRLPASRCLGRILSEVSNRLCLGRAAPTRS